MWVMEKMEVRMNALARSSPEPAHVFIIFRLFRYLDISMLINQIETWVATACNLALDTAL